MKQKYQINCITGKYKLWIEEGKISDCNLKIQGEKILVIIVTGKYKLWIITGKHKLWWGKMRY